jgi:hypothetical protein
VQSECSRETLVECTVFGFDLQFPQGFCLGWVVGLLVRCNCSGRIASCPSGHLFSGRSVVSVWLMYLRSMDVPLDT